MCQGPEHLVPVERRTWAIVLRLTLSIASVLLSGVIRPQTGPVMSFQRCRWQEVPTSCTD